MTILSVFSWYLMIALSGWLAFPLASRLLSFLPDRGLSLSRPLGLLLWGYLYWLLVSLGVLQNDAGGGLLALLGVAAGSFLALRKTGWRELRQWVREKARLVAATEALFLVAFFIWAVIRATMPDASGTEKPMELAFIHSILRSPTFPPQDPWLSGYAISYYYFGYVMVALLAKMASVSGAVAFNLAIASWFALTGLAAYGILYNLLALRSVASEKKNRLAGLLAPFFVLIAGNLEGFLEMLHARGVFWSHSESGTGQSSFWSWLNIQELTSPPSLPLSWTPSRASGIWWWRASRVLQDFALDKTSREVIDEFPMFSYLLGDLHPHLLAMPFTLLAVGLALNVYRQGRAAAPQRRGLLQAVQQPAFWLSAVVLGGLSFLNTWDFPIYLVLFASAAVLSSFLRDGWRTELAWDFLTIVISLGLAGVILYLPFYLSFASQANGILPSLVFFTRGVHLWVMFGLLWLPTVAWMVWAWRKRGAVVNLAQGGLAAVGLIAGLWLASSLYGAFRLARDPSLAGIWGAVGGQGLISASVAQRFNAPGGWLTLLFLLALVAGTILSLRARQKDCMAQDRQPAGANGQAAMAADGFVLLIFLVGLGLVVFPEFFYLRDQFGFRMNTIFKFYFQSWVLWGIAAGYASVVLLRELRGAWGTVFTAAWVLLILLCLPYPFYGILSRTNQFHPLEWSLDGASYIRRYLPDEMEAIQWLQQAPYGVVAEAVGGSYTGYARVSTHSGLPTVLGWPGHESQWRGGAQEIGSRQPDIARLYRAGDWKQASEVLEKYHIRYVYVGPTETYDFRPNEALFARYMAVVFRNNSVAIYEYRSPDSR